MNQRVTVNELAALVAAEVVGDGSTPIHRVATLAGADGHAIGFCGAPRYLDHLRRTDAGAVLLRREHLDACPTTALVVADPYLAYARIAERLHPRPVPDAGVHPTAVVAEDAALGQGVSVGPHTVVDTGASLGRGVVVGPGCHVGAGAHIGDGSRLLGRVTVGERCILGRRAVLNPGVVVGSDGFGFARGPGAEGWHKVPQLGRVIIGDDVDLGANVTIDRGAIDDTVIADGVKLDNQVHIAHNVRIGERTIIAGNTVVAGSTTIGRDCMIGGSTAITGHIDIADGVTLMGMTGVTGPIRESGAYASPLPAQPVRQWRRNTVRFTQLDDLFRRVKRLETVQGGAVATNSDRDD